jgi:hypothetical protein
MSGAAYAEDNDEMIVVGKPLPRISAAALVRDRIVNVTWETGETEEIDLRPALASHRLFTRLRTDDALFRTMRVNDDGNALEWEDGAELSAVWIEELTLGQLDNAGFRKAMSDLHITLDGMAGRLGISRRLVAAYRNDKPIPAHIALATRYLVEQLKLPPS